MAISRTTAIDDRKHIKTITINENKCEIQRCVELEERKRKKEKVLALRLLLRFFTSVELLLFCFVFFVFFLGATEQCVQTTKHRSVDIGQWAFFGDTNNAFTNSFQSHKIDVYILFLFSIVLWLIIHDSTAAGMTV